MTSAANYRLYKNMIHDPNDVVCKPDNPFADIRNRYLVQIALREVVLRLRNGNYYGKAGSELMSRLNICRYNFYDDGDMAFNQDEGAILRRLMSVFSMRPLTIYTKAIIAFGSQGLGIPNYGLGHDSQSGSLSKIPFKTNPSYTVTAIPLINVTLPSAYETESRAVDLRGSMQATVWFSKDGQIQPREQNVVSVNGLLIFYVNRRVPAMEISTATNMMPFHQLPTAISGFERINTHPVNSPNYITLRNGEDYQLRSVVAVSQTQIGDEPGPDNIITGTTGLIISNGDMLAANTGLAMNLGGQHYLYDPFGASYPIEKQDGSGYFTNKPISIIDAHFGTPLPGGEGTDPSFYERASKSGTVYIYAPVGTAAKKTTGAFLRL